MFFFWGGKQKERKKKKPYNSPGLLPKPRLWPGSANVQFPKSSRTTYQHVLWGKQPNSTPPLFGPKRQCLRRLWKAQEGVEIGKHHIFFSDNCEFPLLHLAFNFHQNKLFTKINVGYNQGPRSFYLWVQRLRNTGLRLHSLLPQGTSPTLLWVAFCWFKARWHGDRWVQTTDIINCNLASKDEWRSDAFICDSELSCSIYRKMCLWGKGERETEREIEAEKIAFVYWKKYFLKLQMTWRNLRV